MNGPDEKPKKGKFVVKQVTSFASLVGGGVTEMMESDLAFQNEDSIVQFEYIKPEVDAQYYVKPGSYILTETQSGLRLKPYAMKKRSLLESVTNTAVIMKEANTFFNRLHIYERLNQPKKRGVLLYSDPGMGKSSSIEKVCQDLINEDPGTVVMVWPTSEIEADRIVRFFSYDSRYTSECTRLILIIEDIGGGEREGSSARNAVDSGLLNLLDGVGEIFKLPTFIIATTNHPQNLLAALCDRPKRFDLLVKLQPPSLAEKIQLMEFIAKRPLTNEEKDAIGQEGAKGFSIAHLEEAIIRAELHDKTVPQTIKELIDHKKLFNNDFEDANKGKMGMNFD